MTENPCFHCPVDRRGRWEEGSTPDCPGRAPTSLVESADYAERGTEQQSGRAARDPARDGHSERHHAGLGQVEVSGCRQSAVRAEPARLPRADARPIISRDTVAVIQSFQNLIRIMEMENRVAEALFGVCNDAMLTKRAKTRPPCCRTHDRAVELQTVVAGDGGRSRDFDGDHRSILPGPERGVASGRRMERARTGSARGTGLTAPAVRPALTRVASDQSATDAHAQAQSLPEESPGGPPFGARGENRIRHLMLPRGAP